METYRRRETAAQRKHRKEVQEDCPWTSEHLRAKRRETRGSANEGKGGKIGNSKSKVRQPLTTTAYATNRHTTEPPEHLDQMENGPK